MIKLSFITAFCVLSNLVSKTVAFPRKFYAVDPEKVDITKVSTDVSTENSALNSCQCDITRGSCDAYCCCDTDCDDNILNEWRSRYDEFCAKNFLDQAFRPAQRCIDTALLWDQNLRMGLVMTVKGE